MIVSMIAALALQASEPAKDTAPAGGADKPAADAGKKKDKPEAEKKICRSDGNVVGSRMPTKICKTKAQWDAEAEDARLTANNADKLRNDNNLIPP